MLFTVHESHIHVVAAGEYTYEDVVDAFEAAIEHAGTRLPVLVDARQSKANPPFDEMVQTAMFSQSIADDIGPRIALVVEGALRYGLARMLSSLAGTDGKLVFQPFREVESARAWLDAKRDN